MHGVASNSVKKGSRKAASEHLLSLPLEDIFTPASVDKAGLPRRILTMFLNTMKRQFGAPSISTVRDLVSLSERRLTSHFGVGPMTVIYVKKTLAGHGLALANA